MSDNEMTTFHNEDVVFRIAMWANIVGWSSLVLAVVNFLNIAVKIVKDASQIFAPAGMPDAFFTNVNLVTAQLLAPLTGGVFVFLALRAISQGLYILMDMYMDEEEFEEYYEDDVEVEDEE